MAKRSVILLSIVVLLFGAGTIEGDISEYVSEDLKIDPTKCKVWDDENIFKLQDIARHSNGISVLTIFGQTHDDFLFVKLGKMDHSMFYGLYIYENEVRIKFHFSKLLNETLYYHKPLDLSKFVKIDIQLVVGAELHLKVLLPNGAEVSVVDKEPFSIETVYFGVFGEWYFRCPEVKALRTFESSNSASEVFISSTEHTGDYINKTNKATIVGCYWKRSKAKLFIMIILFMYYNSIQNA